MTTARPDVLDSLRDLLHAAGRDPRQTAVELCALRRLAAGDGDLGRELLVAEARWLVQAAATVPELRAEAAAASSALREFELRCVLSGPESDVEALLELAEFEGERRAAGDHEAAAAAAAAIAQRLPAVRDLALALQEADERFAAHTAIDDDRGLRVQAEMLVATGRTLVSLGTLRDDARLVRRGRRSLRAGWDRELVLRLEQLFGRRGVAWLEATSFLLLLVVLGVLIVESMWDLSAPQQAAMFWIDALACSFFVAEFAVRFALAPHRWSWFLRNAVTDLLPAIPAVLFLLPGPELPPAAGDAVVVRLLRFFRITWAARYVQALRPVLRLFRLALILVRGMDGLVRRFGPLLDRNFVFFENVGRAPVPVAMRRDIAFAALRREQLLLSALPAEQRAADLRDRLHAVAAACSTQHAVWPLRSSDGLGRRDVPVEEAAEFLWSLSPAEVGHHLSPSDLRALDRVVRVLHARPLRWLPLLKPFAVHPLPPGPEERIVALGHRVAAWLQGWQARLQFLADLHGIVTGPQILDRVASAMVKASQRPAVRLLFFGGLFLLFDLLIRHPGVSLALQRIVVGPLLILGSVCLVVLGIGWWLKRVAGEASETFRLTAEANFLSLLDLVKRRHEAEDVRFLARRVFGSMLPPEPAERLLLDQLATARAGVPLRTAAADPQLRQEANRTALLYLHFLDGAVLHQTDVTNTEQLLANCSLQNLRHGQLGQTRRQVRQLRQLRLDDGSIFRGPFLWFRFITESIAVETAKRITEYNRRCIPLAARQRASAQQLAELEEWLQKRCDPKIGRTLERLPPPDAGTVYVTTEFNALDFLAADPERDDHIREVFGDQVLAALRADRRNMIREIFGMRPVHLLPRHSRSFNAWRLYWSRLSHGRILLAPLYSLWRMLRTLGMVVAKIRRIVREVLAPHLELQQRQPGEAPFAVALRKIHRMKAPQLLEAMQLRVLLDPAYGGTAPGWTRPAAVATPSELERDCDFLHLRERERAEFRRTAERNTQRVAELHALLPLLPPLGSRVGDDAAADGELAVTVAFCVDRDDVRTLLLAEHWLAGVRAEAGADRLPRWWRQVGGWVRDRFTVHPVEEWASRHSVAMTLPFRHVLRQRYASDDATRRTIDAWARLEPGRSPGDAAIAQLRRCYLEGPEIRREIAALRTIQSLSVLDVRNYRDLVFRIGDYARDGEDAALGSALP